MLFKKQDGKETRCKIKDSESSATLSLCSADSCCNWWNSINICLPGYVELNIHIHWLLLWQIDPNASQLFARKLPSPLSLTSDCGCKKPPLFLKYEKSLDTWTLSTFSHAKDFAILSFGIMFWPVIDWPWPEEGAQTPLLLFSGLHHQQRWSVYLLFFF